MHLLDANTLIALGWPAHEHHEPMQAWFKSHARQGWATTAMTQAAFVRIVSQPAFSGRSLGVGEVAELLLRNLAHAQHRLLPLDFGFEQVLGRCSAGVVGHRQITDAYLLTAAMQHGMKLLTFDTGLPALLKTAAERQRHITLLKP
jgi:uncharacterized protein